MTHPATIAQTYLQTWNETDAATRAEWLDRHWTDDARYDDPMASVRGAPQIDALIADVQQRFEGFRFTLRGEPDGFGDHLRFAWSLGPDGAEPPIKGSDVVELRDGRIARVIGFLDQVPAG